MFLLLFAALPAIANHHLTLNEKITGSEQLEPYILRWQGDKKEIDELAESLHFFSLWQPYHLNKSISSWGKEPVQLLIEIENRSDIFQEMVMVYSESLTDCIKVIVIEDGIITASYEAGNLHEFQDRPIPHRDLIFPIGLSPGKNVAVLIELTGRLDRLSENLYLWERHAFFERTDTDLFYYAIYLGIVMLISIYILLLFSVTKDFAFLWFALFALTVFLRAITTSNIPFELLWPNTPALQNIFSISFTILSTGFLALFVMCLLNVKENYPFIYKLFVAYLAAHLLALLHQAHVGWSIMYVAYWLMLAFPFSLIIITLAFIAYKRGNPMGGFLLFSYVTMVLLGLIVAGNHFFDLNLPITINDESGELVFLCVMAVALSLKLRQMQRAEHIAYAQSKAKSDFMAKMSHEIRTPINGVLGMAQLLSETPLSRKQQHYAEVINHCSKTLLNVINDILEYAKIESGKLEFEHTPFNFDELLQHNNDLFWPQIKAKNINYRFVQDPYMPTHFKGDPTRIQQMLNNLFSNAIKFTDHGYIDLEVRLQSTDHKKAIIEIRLKDTGIGMSEEELEKIFTPFTQASTSTTRLYGGSGLGLNITRQLVNMMGGEIHVESHLKIGTEFCIELPLEIDTKAQQESKKSLDSVHGKHILIISPDAENHDQVRVLLRSWHFDTTCFPSINDALLASHDSLDSFDVICISAPLLTELNPGEKIALRPYLDHTLIFDYKFHLTPLRLPGYENVRKLLAPFSSSQLQTAMLNLLGIEKQTPEEVKPDASDTYKPRKHINLLVAEDDATNRLVIRAILKKLEIEHEIVTNGLLATEFYTRAPDQIDLILMDCEMPEMDGYEAAATIREFEKQQGLNAIPIIALTAHVLPEFEKRCYESGMNQVIGKPIHVEELTAAFDKYCID